MIEKNADFEVHIETKIPMRDGVSLNGTLYIPTGGLPIPAITTITPYASDIYHERGNYFAQNGYAFLIVDCRGRGNSGGEFTWVVNEGQDGYDVVEWLARRPWCDGQVGMWGGSYAGSNQWLTLKQFPPHLKTIVPAAANYIDSEYSVRGPLRSHYFLTWHVLTHGKALSWNLNAQADYWARRAWLCYRQHIPFHERDTIFMQKEFLPFREYARRTPHDPWWEQLVISPTEFRKIEIPILTITGQYDLSLRSALDLYRLHMKHGNPQAISRHYALVGPWDHAGTRTPRNEFGGLHFSDNCLLDLNRLHKEWYDHVFKGKSLPEFLKSHITYYTAGTDEWKYCDNLDTVCEPRRFFLQSIDGQANDVFQSGLLKESPPVISKPDEYIYDPLDTRPGELELNGEQTSLIGNGMNLQLFGNGLVYHTQPFEQDVELTGFVRLVLWLQLDVPDTDFEVFLSEITVDGMQIKLSDACLRTRYRHSSNSEKLVTPGEIICIEFNNFTFFSRKVTQGNRLRLLVRCPNSIYIEKNYNSGGQVGLETAAEACVAHIQLYHDADHPSYLELPVVHQ